MLILVNQNRFGSRILLTNLAYDIATTVRQAQTYGLGIREFNTGGSNNFTGRYGVHFDNASGQFLFFVDVSIPAQNLVADYKYTNTNELLKTLSIGSGNRILSVCAVKTVGEDCIDGTSVTYLDIMFERPNPDAIIRTNINNQQYQSARIIVVSPDGFQQTVTIQVTGQISVS